MTAKAGSLQHIILRLHQMSRSAEECADLIQNALIYNAPRFLDEAEAKAKEIHETEKILTRELVAEAQTSEQARMYLPVPGHFERIGDSTEGIITCIRTKIREDILFSDKAISEISFLLQRIKDVLSNTSDIILARNMIIGKYIIESQTEINKSANDFATKHEERLISGVCTPKASSVFLDILDAIKGISWHAKEVAAKLIT